MKFKHYIITRFNLKKNILANTSNNIINDESWLKERYFIFEEYCLKSIESQTNKNFEWWVYFDDKIDEKYLKINNKFINRYKFFKPKYESSFENFKKKYVRDLHLESVNKKLDFILTTRLDNDDVISKDFVDLLQKTKFDSDKILEFPYGYSYNIKGKKELRDYYSRLNPFISLLEKVNVNNDIKGIYAKQHGEWSDYNCEIISEEKSWIQIVHESNRYNTLKGKLSLSFNSKKFGIEKINIPYSTKIKILKKEIKKKIKRLF